MGAFDSMPHVCANPKASATISSLLGDRIPLVTREAFRSTWRSGSKMRGVGSVGCGVIQHGGNRGGHGSSFGQTGKDSAVADVASQDKRWALRDLQGMKFDGAGADAYPGFLGLRFGQQLPRIQ